MIPEKYNLSHVLATIMSAFGAYDLQKIMNTPYCHVLKLYELACRANDLQKLNITIGNAAMHDKEVLAGVVNVGNTATSPDQEQVKRVLSPESKADADRIAQAISKRSKGV